jgi:hypothetical protein
MDVRHFEHYQGGECLSNAHWLGPWGQHFDDELRLRQNHRKNQEVGLLYDLFCGAALHKVTVDFGWKIWLLSFFLNGKAFTLNKTNKTYIV